MHPAEHRGDDELQRFPTGWEGRMVVHEQAARTAAIASGDEPDAAVVGARRGLAGRAGHGVASALGTAGEWLDGHDAR